MRAYIERLRDPERDIYKRRYELLTVTTLFAFALILFTYCAAAFPLVPILFYAGCLLLLFLTYVAVMRGVSLQITSVLTSLFFLLVHIPFAFMRTGGTQGGAAYWPMIALVYVFLCVKGRIRHLLFVLDLLVTVFCFYLEVTGSPLFVDYPDDKLFVGHVLLFAVCMLLLGAGFLFHVYTMDKERSLLEQQRDELFSLHLARVSDKFDIASENDPGMQEKKRVMITCDSACDLPARLYEEFGIAVIRHILHTDNGVFLDGEEIGGDELMYYMRDENKTVKSEVPDREKFEHFFAACLNEAQEIIHISIAKDASPVYGYAKEAEEFFDHVTVIDSGSMSGGAGMLVLYAAHLARDTELAPSEITKRILRVKTQMCARFILEDTAYLVRGGRMKPGFGRLLDAFLLHPSINMRDDKMKFFFTFGVRYKRDFLNRVIAFEKDADTSLLIVTYAGMQEERIRLVMEIVASHVHFDRVIAMPTSSAVAVNVGPGTFGVMFHKRSGDSLTGGRLFDFLQETEDA